MAEYLHAIRRKEDNYKKKLIPKYNNNTFIYYYSKWKCMYNKSPCSNFKKNKNNKKIQKKDMKFIFEN